MTPPRDRRRAIVLVLLPLILGVVFAGWVYVDARNGARARTDAAVRADAAANVAPVGAAIRAQLASATLTGGTSVPLGGELAAHLSPEAVVLARDSGAATIDDGMSPPEIVVPLYSGSTPPQSTAGRRALLTGYRVVPLSLASALSGTQSYASSFEVLGPSGHRHQPAGARGVAAPLDVGGATGWVLHAWQPTKGIATGSWLIVAALVLAGAARVLVMRRARQWMRAATAHQHRLERQTSLVSGLAPIVQASLDLGEVIPAATYHLANGLQLAGLSLSAPSPTGERQLFAWGEVPDSSTMPPSRVPDRLDVGETFALPLARGGRIIGMLRLIAGTPLDASDLRAMETASELLGSTLANAEAFAQQQTLVERMQSVDELKTVFLATASHELRTPVAAILGFSQLVLDQWDHGDRAHAKEFLTRVLANARSLESLTEQLLDFSRLERGIIPTSGELLDLAATVRRVLAEHAELTTDHELELDLAPGCLVQGSEPGVARIVSNLVGNAAKYSPKGTCITVTLRSSGDRVLLVVDDEGPGVHESDRERIFTRFYRGRGDTVASTRGTGVGLAIVKEFTVSMSGTVTVERAPSGGARFCVSLPAAPSPGATSQERDPHVQHA